MSSGGTVVIGVGNAMRGDDAAGLHVARRVHECAPQLRVLELEREPSGLIEAWAGADQALVVDAVLGSAKGRVHRIDPEHDSPIARLPAPTSTHALGLGAVIELARSLGRLPGRMVVFGIESDSYGLGKALTRPVAARVGELAETVIAEASAPPLIRGRSARPG